MVEENTDIPLVVEVNGDEGSKVESFDVPAIAVVEISEPKDIIEESIGIPLALEVSGDEGSEVESFDVPAIAVVEISEPKDIIIEESIDIPLALEVSGDEGSEVESFDVPAIAVVEISEPKDIIEESIDIPLAVEVNEDDGSQNENFDIPATTEVNEPESCNVEVVEISTPKIRPKIFSRYLLPYTGSCHDLCKYGGKHHLEENHAGRGLRRVKSSVGNGRDLRRAIVSLEKQDKDVINSKSSPHYKAINITDLKEDVISSPEIVTPSPKRLLPSIKEVQAAAVHYSRTKLNFSLTKASSFAGQGSSGTKRNKVRKGKKQDGDGCSSSCTNSTSGHQEINISAEEDIKALVPRVASWTPRSRVKRVAIANKKIIGRRGLKNQVYRVKSKPDPSNNEVVEEKILYMIEPSTKNEAEESAQNSVRTTELSRPQSSSATDNSLKHEQEADGIPIVPLVSLKKNMSCARNGTSSKNLSASSPASRVFKGMKPKRFGVIQRSETRSAPSSPLSSRYPSEPVHGEHGGPTSGNDVKMSEKLKVEHKIKTRRMTLTDTENGDCQSRKLKFRKGRIVELQTESITPKRLKFRRVRLLGETQSPKSDIRKRNILGKVANQNDDEVNEAENSSLRLEFRRVRILGETQSPKSPKSDFRKRNIQGKEVNQNGDEVNEADTENGDCQSRKLKFRKGRIVELQTESITPRRLKFRRVRLLDETQSSKSDIRKRNIHGKEVNQNGDEVNKVENSSLRLKFRRVRLLGETQSPKSDFRKRNIQGKEANQNDDEVNEAENSSSRLKFRRVQILGETQSSKSPKSDFRKRNIQSKEANQNGDEVKKEAANSSLRQQDQEIKKKKNFRRKETIDGKFVSNRIKSAERVVLRHQDSKGKKEIQNLLNNVIEETASKLAQTRKSKVKALVGAFETVISLQDTRPATTIVT